MKEKVLYVNLPDGASCRRVEVTEDGRIGIVYTEQCVNNEESTKAPLTSWIPKPVPLIGGTEVYQKDNGTPYWYCRIKNSRDEFMYLYFDDLTEADLLYDENGEHRKFTTNREKKFKADVLKALKNKPKKGFTWIPVYEPSPDGKGNVQYVSGENTLIGAIEFLTAYNWVNFFKDYSPENGSHMASITTYFLLLLRWLQDGLVTIEQLAVDSKEIGHYHDSENAKNYFEKTGEREFGGLYGFVGNTYKIVKDSESSSDFSFLGSHFFYNGREYPLGDVKHVPFPANECLFDNSAVGLMELDN